MKLIVFCFCLCLFWCGVEVLFCMLFQKRFWRWVPTLFICFGLCAWVVITQPEEGIYLQSERMPIFVENVICSLAALLSLLGTALGRGVYAMIKRMDEDL